IAVATNDDTSKSLVDAIAPGKATISAIDPVSGISTAQSGGDAVLTVIIPATPTGPTPTGPTPTRTLTPTATALTPTPTATLTASRPPTPTATSVTATPTPVPVEAGDRKCRTKIVSAGGAFVQAEMRAMVACESKVVAGKLPAGTDCANEDKTKKRISKTRSKLKRAIAQACGGKDRTSGAGNDDVALAAIGWDLGTCPNVAGGNCTNAINDCTGITTCLRCMSEAEIAQAVTLYYGALQPTDPKNKAQHALNGCQAG